MDRLVLLVVGGREGDVGQAVGIGRIVGALVGSAGVIRHSGEMGARVGEVEAAAEGIGDRL